MLGLLKSAVVIVATGYVLLTAAAYGLQRQMMFLPTVDRVDPADVGLKRVREVVLRNASGHELYSWYGEAAEGYPTILLFHGNAGAVNHRDYRFRTLMTAGYGLFVLGYPGYGGSGGSPSEGSFVEASRLAYEHLAGLGLEAGDIVIYGESIGSGVAVQLAAEVEARALVLEAPMASAVDVASRHYPFLPTRLLMKDTFYSVDHIDAIDMPLLIMHGERDTIIPVDSGRTLFAEAKEPKSFIELEGAGHNDLYRYPTVDYLGDFLSAGTYPPKLID